VRGRADEASGGRNDLEPIGNRLRHGSRHFRDFGRALWECARRVNSVLLHGLGEHRSGFTQGFDRDESRGLELWPLNGRQLGVLGSRQRGQGDDASAKQAQGECQSDACPKDFQARDSAVLHASTSRS
jgi:hypothetical protein